MKTLEIILLILACVFLITTIAGFASNSSVTTNDCSIEKELNQQLCYNTNELVNLSNGLGIFINDYCIAGTDIAPLSADIPYLDCSQL